MAFLFLAFVKSLLTRKYGLKNIFYSLLFLFIFCVITVRYCGLKWPWGWRPQVVSSEIDNYSDAQVEASAVEVRGEKYVLVLPKRIDVNVSKEVDNVIAILESFHQYDGATCFGPENKGKHYPLQMVPESCWFETRNWTMLISGLNKKKYHRNEELQKQHWIWICNIVEVPFVIRKNVYDRIGLNQTYGEASLLDFFLRSSGVLKIAASRKCSFDKKQSKVDQRPSKPKRQILLDYGLLGYTHNILRIVRHDSITWTKCSYQRSSCPDIPEQQDRLENILLPYCCKTTVNQVLIHTADALRRIAIDYRLCFSTLLGAIRSRTAIPWDGDVDICLKSEDLNMLTFQKLKDALKPSNYSYAYLFGLHRVVPLNAFVKHISNQSLAESDLFSEQVLQHMEEMLPIREPSWKVFPYADFYMYNKIFQRNMIDITVDGLKYPTGERPRELLLEWYGDKYMSTDKKDRINSGAVPGLSVFEKIHRLLHTLYKGFLKAKPL